MKPPLISAIQSRFVDSAGGGKTWSLNKLAKVMLIHNEHLEAMLEARWGFAEHGGRWHWNPALEAMHDHNESIGVKG